MVLLTPDSEEKDKIILSGKGKKVGFWESQRLAKQRAYEKDAKKRRLKVGELYTFSYQLGAMLQGGLSLISALEIFESESENPVLKIIVNQLKEDITGGSSFSDALRKYPNAFPNLFVSMVESGEASGTLAEIFNDLTDHFGFLLALTKRIKGAMIYPLVIIFLAIALVSALLTFVVPVFADMFADFGAKLPVPTQMLINLSHFVKSNFLIGVASITALIYFGMRFFKTPKGKSIRDFLIWRIPVLGTLVQKSNISRFCRTYSVLLRSGVPIIRTIEICSSVTDNMYVREGCEKLKNGIKEGKQFSDIIDDVPYFPKIVRHMARSGEQTGNIEEMILNVSKIFNNDINSLVSVLTSMIEPALVCFLGIVIGSIVVAMFMPIFELSSVVAR